VLPTSLVVAIATVAMTLISALILLWAWRRGLFRDLEAQSRVIFDTRDWRVERPWESPRDRIARDIAYGPAEPAEPGEWGGADRGGSA
jgi:nitrogen fixation-related uncharacterized protein